MSDISKKSLSEFSIEDWNSVGEGAFQRAKDKAFRLGLPIASEQDGQAVWLFEDGHTEPCKSQ